MALRLVRKTSNTPNITNKDDTIMARYAYGGYNGVVKGFGSECDYTAIQRAFKILDGRIVIDGWEIDIDGAGQTLDLPLISGVQSYSIYAEINVATESVEIKSTYYLTYPEIDKGDDLTVVPNGTARLLLYNVKVQNGAVVEVVKRFEIVPYLTQKVLDIEKRLDELGFKQGVASVTANGVAVNADVNSLKKQGKYCIFNLTVYSSLNINHTIAIPEGFRPLGSVVVPILVGLGNIYYNAVIDPNGDVRFSNLSTVGNYYQILNAGWEIA